MRNAFIILSVLLFSVGGCQLTDQHDNQNEITVDMIDPEHPPVMVFESLQHDFGNVALGEKLIHTFKFKNEGESALLIHSVTPSCNCTVLKNWPREPLQPGESGEITAQFEGKYAGANVKTISIVANTRPSNVTKLTLTAKVVGAE